MKTKECLDGVLWMLNLFAFRATDPTAMMAARDPVGPDNDSIIQDICDGTMPVVVAWGNDGRYRNRDKEVLKLIGRVTCLKVNKDGSPAHPLYLPGSLTPKIYG